MTTSPLMRSKLALGCAVLALAGCMSQQLEGYVGQSITAPMIDLGEPTNTFDMPDGQRAFQWRVDDEGVRPVETSSVTVVGADGATTFEATTTEYVPYSNTCFYTVFATPRAGDWIVTGFREPSFECS